MSTTILFFKDCKFEKLDFNLEKANLIINLINYRLPLKKIILNQKDEVLSGGEIIQTVNDYINNKFAVDFKDSFQQIFFKDLPNFAKRRITEYYFSYERVDYHEDLVKKYFED